MAWSNEKKRYFKKKLAHLKTMEWDLGFQKEKLNLVREDVRNQYDRLKEQTEIACRRSEEEKAKSNPDQTMIDNLMKLKEKFDPDIEYLQKQMDGLDHQLNGPDNNQSVEQQIEGARTVIEMLTSYIKKL